MRLRLLPMAFTVCQVAGTEGISLSPYTFLSCTEDEISLTCPEEKAPENCLNREDGWRCFQVEGPLDFSLLGILSGIAGRLAKSGIPIYAISTYNTDYILVKAERLEEAMGALNADYEITP